MNKKIIILVSLMLVSVCLLSGCTEQTQGNNSEDEAELKYPCGEPVDIVVEGVIVDWKPITESGWSGAFVYLEFDDGNVYAVGYMPCPFQVEVPVKLSLTKVIHRRTLCSRDLINIEYT